MTPKDLAAGLMREVVDENMAIYRTLFSQTSPDAASDQYWKRALALFASLSDEQRSVFFEVIRQVSVDTTSNVLGVIDGVNTLEEGQAGFILLYDQDQKLSGDLQSLFLVEDEGVVR